MTWQPFFAMAWNGSVLNWLIAITTAYPQAARERIELRPPVRILRYKAHLVIYEVRDQVVVLRVRHGREDWLAEMQER